MKLKIWKEDAPVDKDTSYFRLVECGNVLEVNIVHPSGEHEWFVLSLSENGLARHSSLGGNEHQPHLLPVPFPLNKEERVSLWNEEPVNQEVE